jgi:Fe-Mn family superoxide dismutase
MKQYEAKNFNIPTLEGISEKQIEEHLKLYNGYVTNTNLIIREMERLEKDPNLGNNYCLSEIRRRFGFEFDGMRSHEYYFGALETGVKKINQNGNLYKKLVEQFGSLDKWRENFISTATTRGAGWTIMYYDKVADQFIIAWIDEHHLGHLSSLPIVIALDVWEHAFMIDYTPGERKTYIDAYLDNLNWDNVEKNFNSII